MTNIATAFMNLADSLRQWNLNDLFKQDPKRCERFSFQLGPLVVDLSKHFIHNQSLNTLLDIAQQTKISAGIQALFDGKEVNPSEQQAALHWLLRARDSNHVAHPLVTQCLAQLEDCHQKLVQQQWFGATGKAIRSIVNLGVGGSDLGPRLLAQALSAYRTSDLDIHFVSNIDGKDLQDCLKQVTAEETLFVIASKSFSTLETLTNARSARAWLCSQGIEDHSQHLIAICSEPEKAQAFGVNAEHVFPVFKWVGGRYSVWSAVSLAAILMIGPDNFKAFLSGAHEVDEHFKSQPLKKNLPFLLGALGCLYINGFGYQHLGIIPYDQRLALLPAYLQQLEMESNGKSVDKNGQPTQLQTAPIVWGGIGTNSQHSFHQLLHQGTLTCPVDFMLPLTDTYSLQTHHQERVANCLAQSQALMQGLNDPSAPHKCVPGNKPSTLIGYADLNPRTLGALLALYEHKTYIQSLFWNINAFDQWGVEVGKQLSRPIFRALTGDLTEKQASQTSTAWDASTKTWIQHYKNIQK